MLHKANGMCILYLYIPRINLPEDILRMRPNVEEGMMWLLWDRRVVGRLTAAIISFLYLYSVVAEKTTSITDDFAKYFASTPGSIQKKAEYCWKETEKMTKDEQIQYATTAGR